MLKIVETIFHEFFVSEPLAVLVFSEVYDFLFVSESVCVGRVSREAELGLELALSLAQVVDRVRVELHQVASIHPERVRTFPKWKQKTQVGGLMKTTVGWVDIAHFSLIAAKPLISKTLFR